MNLWDSELHIRLLSYTHLNKYVISWMSHDHLGKNLKLLSVRHASTEVFMCRALWFPRSRNPQSIAEFDIISLKCCLHVEEEHTYIHTLNSVFSTEPSSYWATCMCQHSVDWDHVLSKSHVRNKEKYNNNASKATSLKMYITAAAFKTSDSRSSQGLTCPTA